MSVITATLWAALSRFDESGCKICKFPAHWWEFELVSRSDLEGHPTNFYVNFLDEWVLERFELETWGEIPHLSSWTNLVNHLFHPLHKSAISHSPGGQRHGRDDYKCYWWCRQQSTEINLQLLIMFFKFAPQYNCFL